MHVANVVAAVVAALVGLVGGSYAGTLIERVPDDENVVAPLGRCPHCRQALRLPEMLPVIGWLRRRGACAHCDKPFGARHLVVEVVTGLAFALVALRFGPSPELPAYLYLAYVGIVLSGIDAAVKRLPDVLTLPSYPAMAGLLALAVPHVDDGPRHFAGALVGMAGLWLVYFVLWLINPRGMAWGDVKLSGPLGLGLGWLGANAFIVGAFAGFVFGAVYGLSLVALRKAGRKSAIPFGPFMVAGAFLAILAAQSIPLYGTA